MKEKFALITGASAGIGYATAHALAQSQFNLILLARREEKLLKLKEELQSYKVQVEVVAVDVQNEVELRATLEPFQKQLSNLVVLINNAGLAKGVDTLENGKSADWDQMIDTNLKALLYVTKYCLPYLKKQNSAHIINLGSISSHQVYPGGAVYCATKHGVYAVAEALRLELLGSPVHVTTISPGLVETEFSLVRFNQDRAKAEQVYKGVKALTAQDIAETILWCVSRPPHVQIQEIILTPLQQARVDRVHRDV